MLAGVGDRLGGGRCDHAGGTAATDVDARLRALGWVPTSYGEMEVRPAGQDAEGRYEHPDDPDAALVVDVAAPGQADPYVSLGRYGPTYEEGDAHRCSTRWRPRPG